MLSILIPTYKYDIYNLVQSIYNQCTKLNISFEIISYDDGSGILYNNNKINQLCHCTFSALNKNIGRSAIRNLLAKKAQYKWLLFLDADVEIIDSNFIKNYIDEIQKDNTPKIIYGGIVYQKETPKKESLLRWAYGNKREAITAKKRDEEKYLSFLTLNFIIHKNIFQKISFNEKIPNLRNEDLLFSFELQQKQIPLKHINNQVCHLGIETTEGFLEKTNEVSISYLYLWKHQLLPYNYTPYGKAYKTIKKLFLTKTVGIAFKIIAPLFIKNLKSKSPSMLIYDLYRLGHICSLNPKKALKLYEKYW